ncbi:glutathione S-transferase family protein [Sphingomonas profundi]|uniref:glutathione S-transferase family protein n=1 Tax=Alterirhizorhabdus profundi TaxID=2681549 RepID=UPI001E2BCB75|nr:glutathione S-transferase family protein [Sphingomonas profundi]
MKLLNSFVSPFAARVRLAIYAYDLRVEIAPSGQWLPDFQKSPDYLAINPIGKVPTLVLDDGTGLPESTVIVEYLADAFATGLRPRDAQAAARARLLAHLMEIYVQEPGSPLIGQIFSGERNAGRIEGCIAAIDQGLSHVDHFIAAGTSATTREITIADCALVPYLYFFVDKMVPAVGGAPLINKHPAVAAYWEQMQEVPTVQKVLGEMHTAIAQSPLKKLLSASD